MMGMIAWLAARTGLSRAVVALLGAVGLCGLLWAGKALYDRSIIREHEQGQETKLATIIRQADAHAADARITDQKRNQADEDAERAAVEPLPDARLSDRQRQRACAILLRQARERGHEGPAVCRSDR